MIPWAKIASIISIIKGVYYIFRERRECDETKSQRSDDNADN